MGISSHVLDTSLGKPASGITIALHHCMPEDGQASGHLLLSQQITNVDGRVQNLLSNGFLFVAGHYRLHFALQEYFASTQRKTFYPFVQIDFYVENPNEHFHVPLLLQPFGYSTYRGS